MSEKVYDEQVAPLLRQAMEICSEHDMPMIAVVEYVPGDRGLTRLATPEQGIEMVMIGHCAKTAPNVDSYIIGLKRWALENGVDISSSLFLRD